MPAHDPASPATGLVLHSPLRYDLMVWLMTLGRERSYRERILQLARLQSGEAVLDAGCGTGTLAIAAKRRVGPQGSVFGVDASPEMIARAEKKARKAGVNVVFTTGVAQALPLPGSHLDAVLSTVMLHHLPRPARRQFAGEIRRVLKPGGRVLAVDFGEPTGERSGVLSRFHHHGYLKLDEIVTELGESGLRVVDSGRVGISSLEFVLAAAAG